MQKNSKTLRREVLIKLTTTAMMIALAVILCRYLGFPPSGAYRIEISFLPIAIVAILFGPIWSGVAYGLADFIGAILFTGVNPFITLCKILLGFTMGLVFYRKNKIGLLRNILYFVIAGLVIDIGLMTPIFVHFFGFDWKGALSYRFLGFCVNTPARIGLIFLADQFLLPSLYRYIGKKSSFASYANGFQVIPRLGLKRISALLCRLGNPEKNIHCIHVAGTNGKGSVCAFTESILSAAGYKVGKYTSPDLVKVNERICYDGKDISDEDLGRLLAKIEQIVPAVEKELNDKVTQFEIWTAAAFLYFAEKKPDYVILETGMGGEFDATNVICGNVMSVLTEIALDHTEYLGDTIEKIATTKSKIIKKNCESGITVASRQGEEAISVIRAEAERNGLQLRLPEEAVSEGFDEIYEIISYGDMHGLRLGLGGVYQKKNAETAICVALALGVSEEAVRKGLADAKNPARFEKLSENPTVIYDGGHNPNGVRALKDSIDRYYPEKDRTVIFACMADKDFIPNLEMLNDGHSEFIFTTVQNNERAMGAKALAEKARENGIDGEYVDTLKEALKTAREKNKLTVICGSLYLYQDLR